jgi:Ca-activated chloride channel family protein
MDPTVPTNGGSAAPTVAFDPNRTQAAPPPVPSGGRSLSLRIRPGSTLAYAGDRTRSHLLVDLEAAANRGPSPSGGRRLPVNLALVIDRSGSMEGEPLEYVKRACAYVVDMLGPDDILSIVTFEESVDILMPARRVTDPALIKQHLARIVPGNTTNLFDGLYAGGAQVASVPQAGFVARVVLLTDGEPTAGLKDFQSIVGQVADLKARGITVTALGFGPEYNEELLAGIARRSGGNYTFIARPEQIPEVFQREVASALGTTAQNVRLTLHLPRGCTVTQCYGAPVTFGPRTAEIALPDLERGASLTKLFEVDWDRRAAAPYRVAKAVLSYDDGATGRREVVTQNVVVDFVDELALAAQGVDPDVAREIQVAQASRDLEKTMMGMRTQQMSVADATAMLDRTQVLLAQEGRADEAREVAQAADALRRGDDDSLDKTLIGTIYHLDLGKRS